MFEKWVWQCVNSFVDGFAWGIGAASGMLLVLFLLKAVVM